MTTQNIEQELHLRKIERYFLQAAILEVLTITGNCGLTFEQIRKWVFANPECSNFPDLLALQMEICSALMQMHLEHGSIIVLGEIGKPSCFVRIPDTSLRGTSH